MNPLVLQIIQMLATAEPAIIQAIHNLMNGTGTADDIAILVGDQAAWQSIAEKAQQEIDKLKPPQPAPPPVS